MSQGQGQSVAPVGPSHNSSLIPAEVGSWQEGFRQVGREFGEGFAVGASFSSAVMGAGLNAITAGAKGQVRGNFG